MKTDELAPRIRGDVPTSRNSGTSSEKKYPNRSARAWNRWPRSLLRYRSARACPSRLPGRTSPTRSARACPSRSGGSREPMAPHARAAPRAFGGDIAVSGNLRFSPNCRWMGIPDPLTRMGGRLRCTYIDAHRRFVGACPEIVLLQALTATLNIGERWMV